MELFIVSCGDDEDKRLNILYWQAPVIANPYLAGGGLKDVDASALVLEPLANYDERGRLSPRLAEEIPTVENGGVSRDMTAITWKLKEGILWSDGTALTAEDLRFTHKYLCSLPATETVCGQTKSVEPVAGMSRGVKITFVSPVVYPYTLFVGASSPVIQKAQFENCLGEAAVGCRTENMYPVGTGPYKITDFTVSESEMQTSSVLTYEINEKFRESDQLFSRVVIKGGGDAATSARAVLETGEADYAWNLQVDPSTILRETGKGTVRPAFAAKVEQLVVNFTDPEPDPASGKQPSEWADGKNPHPFLTETAVRRALSLAIDRNHIAQQLYGATGKAVCNLLAAPAQYVSPNNDNCLDQDIDGANMLLDDAGWIVGDAGIRQKEGKSLKIVYRTSTNPVRQKTQELIQGWWREIGVETKIESIDGGVFFSNNLENPDNLWRFHADIQMYTRGAPSVDPQSYLATWQTSEITSSENNWLSNNISRWSNERYDNLYRELTQAPIGKERERLVIEMNDLLIQNYVVIPLVHRAIVSAFSKDLKGVRPNDWDSSLWNINQWYRR